MDLGPHAVFIWASYGLFMGVLLGLVLWVFWYGAYLKTKISELESRGVSRRGRTSPSLKSSAKN